MSKIAVRVLFVGLVFGFVFAVGASIIALDHNPQRAYTDNFFDLAVLFYVWLSVISFPFSFVAAIIFLLGRWRSR